MSRQHLPERKGCVVKTHSHPGQGLSLADLGKEKVKVTGCV